MRGEQKERRCETVSEREKKREIQRAVACASVLVRRVTGEYSFIKLEEEGRE